ncbi:MAG: hypothetical protein AAGE94_23335, partial [Acidobacteriota bacterium]
TVMVIPWLGPWPLIGLVALYAAANLAATAITAPGFGPGAWWRLPIAFSLLHVGYGVGFLAGLVRFAHRWGSRA